LGPMGPFIMFGLEHMEPFIPPSETFGPHMGLPDGLFGPPIGPFELLGMNIGPPGPPLFGPNIGPLGPPIDE
jgi:hypothetical protein